MHECGPQPESQNVRDLFFEEEEVKPLGGEIIMEGTTDEVMSLVEKKLSIFNGNIHRLQTHLQIQNHLESVTWGLLGRDVLEFKDTEDVDDTDVDNIVAIGTESQSDTEHDKGVVVRERVGDDPVTVFQLVC